MLDNLAARLCLLLPEKAVKAERWKLLGQERDGALLVGWMEEFLSEDGERLCRSVLGFYNRIEEQLEVLHRFSEEANVVQATVNQSRTLLGYVTKQRSSVCNMAEVETEGKEDSDSAAEVYQVKLIELSTGEIRDLETERNVQTRIQFLYRRKERTEGERFLVLVHRECVSLYTVTFETTSADDRTLIRELKSECLVRTFIWAQWDCTEQVLYHIHHRRAPTSLVTEDANENRSKTAASSPTLSGLQFHDHLPHETVLNIPLNLPQMPNSTNCGTYEDDVVPLRVHDCSLDLVVVSDAKGMVCVCHHYLYRPVKPPLHVSESSLDDDDDSSTVHFAYSVTLLHHSCVIHCVVPGVPWSRAKLMRPTFAICEDDHMIVFAQGSFTHLLEIGTSHEPCCHILCGPLTSVPSRSSYLVPLLLDEANESGRCPLTVDLPTLDLVPLRVPADFLLDTFRGETSTDVRVGVLHHFLCHRNDPETVAELVSIIAEKPRSLNVARLMREILAGLSYAAVRKNLLADAQPLLALLPFTTVRAGDGFEARVNELNVTLSHEKLWNTSVMLLSPQQRLTPYSSDLWTRLWDRLNRRDGDKPRFEPSQVMEKLMVSLACYQPEALSRCSTPMSPSGGLVVATASLGDLMGCRSNKILDSGLPFIEMESCTASKQEHIVSVNLRELSMHLLKYGVRTSTSSNSSSSSAFRVQGSCTSLHVHAMATRYVAAQLEASRALCLMLCRAANVDPKLELERGFVLVDQLDEQRRWLLFTLLERYRYAAESCAFPVPQGFTSFFTYLGYRTLSYPGFLQYVQRSVFELQVDVTKVVMADTSDTREGVFRKLQLLSLLPRSRAKRLLNQWLHPASLMLRAREHAANVLSGETCQNRGRLSQHRIQHNGLAAFPSADRLSPLDTFLDLLTAKASLAELDFGLLIEATVTSTEDLF